MKNIKDVEVVYKEENQIGEFQTAIVFENGKYYNVTYMATSGDILEVTER